MLRARDMALAEQRARHVKESIVIQEQRQALAVSDPAFSGKIAKLFGWMDAVGGQTSNPSLCVSPALSRSASPISSPSTARRTGCEDRLDDGATLAILEGSREFSENDVADVVSGTTTGEMSNSLKVADLPTVAALGDGPDRSSSKEYRKLSSPFGGTAGSAVPLIIDPSNNQETAITACPRCMQLRQELETALTDRTLAEVELVSMRRTISLIEPGVAESEDDGAEKTSPLSPSGTTDNDLDLRDELDRLERLVSLREDGAAPYIDGKVGDGGGLPILQVHRRWKLVCLAGKLYLYELVQII